MPLSDVRSSETTAQNTRGKNFQKFTCSNFRGFVFHGSYFRVLVVGHENFPLYGTTLCILVCWAVFMVLHYVSWYVGLCLLGGV